MGILARDFEQRDRLERDRPQDAPAPEPIQG
jgi:hypothetical protein